MMKRILKNRKGTAEVIGTIMFIVILMFFFTNVYLWHDAATKQMDNMYVQKINTPITLALNGTVPNIVLNVTNTGGIDSRLTMMWIDVHSSSGYGPDQAHYCYAYNNPILAGSTIYIPCPYTPTVKTSFTVTVITTLGNSASRTYTSS